MWKEKERQKITGLIAIYPCDFNQVCFLDQLPYTRWKTMHFKNYVHRLSFLVAWWRHQMETLSPLLAFCAGNLPITGEFLSQRPVTRSSDVFFDLRLNKGLSKQWWGWDSRRHRAHYDVTVMYLLWLSIDQFIRIPFTTHPFTLFAYAHHAAQYPSTSRVAST